LAPIGLAFDNGRNEPPFLLGRAEFMKHRANQGCRLDVRGRRICPCTLLLENETLENVKSAAAQFFRPMRNTPTLLMENALPFQRHVPMRETSPVILAP